MRGAGSEANQIEGQLRIEAARMAETWAELRDVEPGECGGSCFSPPVAIVLGNYGAHIVVDDRQRRVRPFPPLA